jgi:hypothetical protein
MPPEVSDSGNPAGRCIFACQPGLVSDMVLANSLLGVWW